jgi:hypothetical protein
MSNQINWIEPERPEIPSTWFIIINGVNGKAYENYEEYLNEYNSIYYQQQNEPNPFPSYILRWVKGQEPLYLPEGWLILDKFGFIWAFQYEIDFIYYSNLS